MLLPGVQQREQRGPVGKLLPQRGEQGGQPQPEVGLLRRRARLGAGRGRVGIVRTADPDGAGLRRIGELAVDARAQPAEKRVEAHEIVRARMAAGAGRDGAQQRGLDGHVDQFLAAEMVQRAARQAVPRPAQAGLGEEGQLAAMLGRELLEEPAGAAGGRCLHRPLLRPPFGAPWGTGPARLQGGVPSCGSGGPAMGGKLLGRQFQVIPNRTGSGRHGGTVEVRLPRQRLEEKPLTAHERQQVRLVAVHDRPAPASAGHQDEIGEAGQRHTAGDVLAQVGEEKPRRPDIVPLAQERPHDRQALEAFRVLREELEAEPHAAMQPPQERRVSQAIPRKGFEEARAVVVEDGVIGEAHLDG